MGAAIEESIDKEHQELEEAISRSISPADDPFVMMSRYARSLRDECRALEFLKNTPSPDANSILQKTGLIEHLNRHLQQEARRAGIGKMSRTDITVFWQLEEDAGCADIADEIAGLCERGVRLPGVYKPFIDRLDAALTA